MARVKEPKFFMCDGRRPTGQRGPGDAHSVQEWIWRRDDYAALFAGAPPDALCGESTPFYLYDRDAQLRIADAIPACQARRDRAGSRRPRVLELDARLVGRARADRRLPRPRATRRSERIARGWAPFWHYRRLGLYGEQLEHLYRLFPREQVHVLRYKELVDTPLEALERDHGVPRCGAGPARHRPAGELAPLRRALHPQPCAGVAIRTGAAAGAWMHPKVWRTVSVPLVRALQHGGTARPKLAVEDRRALVRYYADDIVRLERLTGRSFNSWLGDQGRGEFASRRLAVAQ